MQTLNERFEEFILAIKGVESVDRLMAQCNLPGSKSADYLALNRLLFLPSTADRRSRPEHDLPSDQDKIHDPVNNHAPD
jgi:hypothetical protein